jgi:hypothetical protein
LGLAAKPVPAFFPPGVGGPTLGKNTGKVGFGVAKNFEFYECYVSEIHLLFFY